MLRTTLDKAHIKRTIRPLYGWTQATPADMKLDPAFDRAVDIWPGMVATKTSGELVTLIGDGSAAVGDQLPFGLFGLYIGGDGIDEVADQGVNSVAVWVLERDAQFEVLAPAFLDTVTWTDPGSGGELLIHAAVDGANQGKLIPAGTAGEGTLSTEPVARLIKVVSDSKLIIGGLR